MNDLAVYLQSFARRWTARLTRGLTAVEDNVNMEKLLTAKQVAEKLNVKTQTVREWFHKHKIPGTVLPSGDLRFDKGAIDRWLESRTVKPHNIGRVHT